jgi:DNA-binding CsgD family transcriptional regulator
LSGLGARIAGALASRRSGHAEFQQKSLVWPHMARPSPHRPVYPCRVVRVARSAIAKADENRLIAELFEALGASLDVRTILKTAYPLLTRLIPADYGALGVSSTAKAEGFEWNVAELPEVFFASYAEMATHDFVRTALDQKPTGVVLRDQEMIARRVLEQNPLYLRAHELGAPLEQVMAVMLHSDERWQSGLSLYRDRTRPFSDAEQARLQRITPALVNAVRNCHEFGVAADWKLALERLLEDPAVAVVLATSNGSELGRSEKASVLLSRWFDPQRRCGSQLPRALVDALRQATSSMAPPTWTTRRAPLRLDVSFVRVSGHFGEQRWLLRLEESEERTANRAVALHRLTERERQVVHALQRGWDNRLIGEELGCAEGTVKKHLGNIFTKLGVRNGKALVAALAEGDDG